MDLILGIRAPVAHNQRLYTDLLSPVTRPVGRLNLRWKFMLKFVTNSRSGWNLVTVTTSIEGEGAQGFHFPLSL